MCGKLRVDEAAAYRSDKSGIPLKKLFHRSKGEINVFNR